MAILTQKKIEVFLMKMNKKWEIINTLISAGCAILCTILAGCKLYCGEMSIKDFTAEINIPTNTEIE